MAGAYLAFLSKKREDLNAANAPVKESNHKIKVDIIGAAVRIQGYPARDGLGITLIRNQAVARIPLIIKMIFPGTLKFDKRERRFFMLFSKDNFDIVVSNCIDQAKIELFSFYRLKFHFTVAAIQVFNTSYSLLSNSVGLILASFIA